MLLDAQLRLPGAVCADEARGAESSFSQRTTTVRSFACAACLCAVLVCASCLATSVRRAASRRRPAVRLERRDPFSELRLFRRSHNGRVGRSLDYATTGKFWKCMGTGRAPAFVSGGARLGAQSRRCRLLASGQRDAAQAGPRVIQRRRGGEDTSAGAADIASSASEEAASSQVGSPSRGDLSAHRIAALQAENSHLQARLHHLEELFAAQDGGSAIHGAPREATKSRRRVAVLGGAFDPITNAHLTAAGEIVHSGQADEVWLVPCGPRPDKPRLKTPVFDRYCMCQIAVNTVFSPEFPVKVSDAELFLPEAAYTYDLLCQLRDRHRDIEFVFVIGSDWLQPEADLTTWPSQNPLWKVGMPEDQRTIITGHKMIQEFDFLVLKRPGCEVEKTAEDPTGLKKFGPRLSWLSMPGTLHFIEGNLSSTEIRKRTEWCHCHDANESWADDINGRGAPPGLLYRKKLAIDGLVPAGVLGYINRQNLYQ